jgi:hypothetical protein
MRRALHEATIGKARNEQANTILAGNMKGRNRLENLGVHGRHSKADFNA